MKVENHSGHSKDYHFETYSSCKAQLKLTLELWNVDDRILLDKSHTKRAYSKKLILDETESFENRINQAQIMRFLQNKYHQFSILNFVYSDLLYFQSQNNLVWYSLNQRIEFFCCEVETKIEPGRFQTFKTLI